MGKLKTLTYEQRKFLEWIQHTKDVPQMISIRLGWVLKSGHYLNDGYHQKVLNELREKYLDEYLFTRTN